MNLHQNTLFDGQLRVLNNTVTIIGLLLIESTLNTFHVSIIFGLILVNVSLHF